jgi:small subunit ribosomal protein S20
VANTKSAQKAMRQAQSRAIRNQSSRSGVRTYFKKATDAVVVTGTAEEAAEVVRAAVRALDRAAQKGIVHPNQAARRKARLMGRLHQLSLRREGAQPEAPAEKVAPKRRAAAAKKGAAPKRATSKAPTVEKKPATARKPAAPRRAPAKKD